MLIVIIIIDPSAEASVKKMLNGGIIELILHKRPTFKNSSAFLKTQ
jgi:hypothetical protein